jgi:hypothetical protein
LYLTGRPVVWVWERDRRVTLLVPSLHDTNGSP